MHQDKFRSLINKYILNHCSGSEVRLFFDYIKGGKFDEILKEEIDKVDWREDNSSFIKNISDFKNVWIRLKKKKILKINFLSNLTESVVFLISTLVGSIQKTKNSCIDINMS